MTCVQIVKVLLNITKRRFWQKMEEKMRYFHKNVFKYLYTAVY